MNAPSAETLVSQATELGYEVDPEDAAAHLVALAGGDRPLLEAARHELAIRLHRAPDDWRATAALTILNRAVSMVPPADPYDWRGRLGRRFRKP